MHQPPTGTVTFLFTDIEGSTKLWQDHPDQMRPALARHDQLLRQTVTENGGYVFKTVGDAFCAAFATAPEALAAALSAQQSLVTEPWGMGEPLRVRMALHTGSAEERDGDYYGPPLNRVARLLAAGHGGQTLLSLATQELTRDNLPAEVTLLDLGEASLKDLARPERVFQLLHPALAADFPPLRSLDNPALPNNLPQQPTSFIGREKQVGEIKNLLAKTRLLTLTGAGGSGKTRLSLQVAADLLDGESDGVWLVELAPLSDPTLVPQAVAQVLGVKEWAGQPVQQTLVDALRAKRLLLVLDNCEHLVAACASLAADLIRNCPQVHILASSREPLNAAGEQTYRVPSLALPDPKQTQTVEALSQCEAVRLFIERAQAVQPSFTVTDANAPAVAQVCWRLDGIPLAIELAAARVRSLPVEEVNARLDDRFRLLTGGSRTTLPRQQTLRALIDWSYDLLTEKEKVLLRRLSVFAGGWTLSAAEVVCAGDGIEDWEVLDLISTLLDKSLISLVENDKSARYRMLETIRQYAHEELVESGEEAALGQCHFSFFLGLAERAEPELTGAEQKMWLERLGVEHANLREAMGWSLSGEDSEAALRLVGATWYYLQMSGWEPKTGEQFFSTIFEGREWARRALATNGESKGRGKALLAAGRFEHLTGNDNQALPLLNDCLGVARASGDKRLLALALCYLGVILKGADSVRAFSLLEESLTIFQEMEDHAWTGKVLSELADPALNQGSSESSLLMQSLMLSRRANDSWEVAWTLSRLGMLALKSGDGSLARTYYEESLTIHRSSSNRRQLAWVLMYLSYTASKDREYAEARSLLTESLGLWHGLDAPAQSAVVLSLLGYVAMAEGDLGTARASFDESLAIRRKLGNVADIAYAVTDLGNLALKQGNLADAQALYRQSLSTWQGLGDRRGAAFTSAGLMRIASSTRQNERAARLDGAMAALCEEIDSPLPTGELEDYGHHAAAVRNALGAEAFAAAFDEGRAMSLDEAVEYALVGSE